MKVLRDCWDELTVTECQYGSYFFNGNEFSIYVSSWLDASPSLSEQFSKKNSSGFVGHCVLKFSGVQSVRLKTSTYTLDAQNQAIWDAPVMNELHGSGQGGNEFYLSGSLRGFFSSIDLVVDASEFELHVLNLDEPVSEGA
ncbi:hypothetical protein [Mitsuaria sp. GD03876]|uniref:hypothetical protein n=1 Tax=Mitsuaria sp. GD03876 TaxID=2975399 RepID=UPI00244B11E4|nr:hypothetical protein [Mitsuaria sp. GD03876]MDH0864655.1 hypothetical protein [Mitsuaria sp. GD03876]